ncbi:MAG: phosphatidylcholine/phosphatidylserine synthase [Mangrovibacterium sp.]
MKHKRNPFFWVPNTITAMNLVSGTIAIFLGLEGALVAAALLILAAAAFDFLDGMSAHLLKSYSEIGKQLDSLADLVSFGLAPAALTASMLRCSYSQELSAQEAAGTCFMQWSWLLPVLLIPVAGAFRLAKFNVDTRQTKNFLGLPIPANAMFYAALALVVALGNHQAVNELILNPWFLQIVILLFSGLMICELPMFSMKFRHLKWSGNEIRFIFLALCLVLLISLQLYAFPLVILSYILLSLGMAFRNLKN